MSSYSDTISQISNQPVFGVALTLGAFLVARRFHSRHRSPLTHPLLTSSIAIIVLLKILGVDYAAYNRGGQLISFLLGPATVALAIPLHRQSPRIRRQILLISGSCAAGAVAAMLVASMVVKLISGDTRLVLSMIPKSVTTPIAMEISRIIGGVPALSSVFVVLTGLLGAMFGPELLAVFNITSPQAVGLALGTAAHGIGTGRALQEGEQVGAYSGLAMGLAGLIVTLLAPMLAALLV